MKNVHAENIFIYVMRYQLRLVTRQNSLSSKLVLHKRFIIEEFDHGSD